MISIQNDDCLLFLEKIDNESVDAIIIDPPYGFLRHKIETTINYQKLIDECYRVLKNNSVFIYFGQQPHITKWNHHCLNNTKFKYKNEIIWYKKISTSPALDIGRFFENIMVFSKGKRKANKTYLPFTDTVESLSDFLRSDVVRSYEQTLESIVKNVSKIERLIEFNSGKNCYPKKQTLLCQDGHTRIHTLKERECWMKQYETVLKGYSPRNLVAFTSPNRGGSKKEGGAKFNHPTVKPVELIEYLIKLFTNEKDLVLDVFLGTGTTAVACHFTNRRFLGCEIDKVYFEMALKRLKQLKNDYQESLL